ncbi:MAG: GNAT family N-acetyltransferase [Flavobacteriales bacterium]
MSITYHVNSPVPVDKVITLYRDSGLNRPVDDPQRIAAMYANSNLVISAWQGEELVGVARSVTDLVYCCYLSDLAVLKVRQGKGIGRELIARTKAYVGDGSMLLLLSAAGAMSYYPAIGMKEVKNGFIIDRAVPPR